MSQRYCEKRNVWIVSYCKRHPITKVPISMRRVVRKKANVVSVERQLIAKVEQKIAVQVTPKCSQVVEEYIQDMLDRDLGKKTIYSASKCLKAATTDWSNRLVTSISRQQIRDLVKVDFENKSKSHQKSILKFIRQTFQFAVESGYINQNPTPHMKFRIGDKVKGVLTKEQVREFLSKAQQLESPWFPVYATALYTGMRNSELYALIWSNVNLKARQINVRRSWNSKDGFKSTKSGDERLVEIAPSLVPILSALKLSGQDDVFVFPRMRKWDKGEQARELRKFLSGVGLPPIRFHDLRATWATIMLSHGIPPVKVMMMGGWKDIKTMQVYMRTAGIEVKGITDNLNLHGHCKPKPTPSVELM